jgi:hypothetical protein
MPCRHRRSWTAADNSKARAARGSTGDFADPCSASSTRALTAAVERGTLWHKLAFQKPIFTSKYGKKCARVPTG